MQYLSLCVCVGSAMSRTDSLSLSATTLLSRDDCIFFCFLFSRRCWFLPFGFDLTVEVVEVEVVEVMMMVVVPGFSAPFTTTAVFASDGTGLGADGEMTSVAATMVREERFRSGVSGRGGGV